MQIVSSVGCLLLLSIASMSQQARVLVGPNVLVSRESDGTSWEHFVAADPTNPLHLLGSSILVRTSHPKGGNDTRAYHSSDGGNSWRTITFPELDQYGGGDPIVAFGRTGTALFVNLSYLDGRPGMHVWRSEDGGATWSKPTFVQRQVDHPQIAVDHTNGRFAGNIYINTSSIPHHKPGPEDFDNPDYHIWMFRSKDDGKSWIGPVTVATNHDYPERGFNSQQPVVFANGDLFATFDSWSNSKEAREQSKRAKLPSYEYGFALSNDGGATFSPPQKLIYEGGNIITGSTRPFFAVDNSEGPYRDRVYIAFGDKDAVIEKDGKITYRDYTPEKSGRIYISYSSDKGKTWAKPKMIAPNARGDQFDISIAVNNQGAVAVSYHDTRDTPEGRSNVLINRYISVSLDGGETFLPAKRITTQPSDPAKLNIIAVGAEARQTTVAFKSGATCYCDYQGLATDLNGVFHPFWSDGRTGLNQTWTTAVWVERPESAGTSRSPLTTDVIEKDVSDKVELYFDPLRQFPAPGTIELPIRIRNKSDKPIFGPIKAEVIPHGADPRLSRFYFRDSVHILNSNNEFPGIGASMDYSRALGDLGVLQPNAITEGVVWRLKAPTNAFEVPNFRIKVTGFIERPKDKVTASSVGAAK